MIHAEVSEAASEDYYEVLAFHGPQSARARSFTAAFNSAAGHLRQWPRSGHRRRDLTKHDVCFWTVDDYYIVFRVRPDMLSIVAILHTSRNVARILRARLRKPRLLT